MVKNVFQLHSIISFSIFGSILDVKLANERRGLYLSLESGIEAFASKLMKLWSKTFFNFIPSSLSQFWIVFFFVWILLDCLLHDLLVCDGDALGAHLNHKSDLLLLWGYCWIVCFMTCLCVMEMHSVPT